MPYGNWNEVFSLSNTVVSASSTSLVFLNADGTHTRLVGTGITYSDGLVTGGTMTGLELFDPNNSTLLVSFTGLNRPFLDFIGEAATIGQIAAVYASLSAFFDLDNANVPSFFSETLIEFTDEDMNVFQAFGTDFGPDGNNLDLENGVVTELRVIDSNGVVLGTSGIVSYDLEDVLTAFQGEGTRFLLNFAASAATDIFIDDTYDANYTRIEIEAGSGAKAFDLNGAGFYQVSFFGSGSLVADLGAGTSTRDGITDTFTGTTLGFGLFEGSSGDDHITMGGNVFTGVFGDAGNDTIIGTSGYDQIEGGAGDDRIEGGAGGDAMWGNGFNYSAVHVDTLAYTTSDAAVEINLDSGYANGGHANGDFFTGFANVIGSDFADILTGDENNNVLTGGDGYDTLSGGGGDDIIKAGNGRDVLIGGAGADNLIGGSGVDEANYAEAEVRVNLSLQTGGTAGDAAGDTFSSVENVTASDFNDYVFGSTAKNVLNGGFGDDRLRGHTGDDTLNGGDDNDDLVGGAGADSLDGGEGIDTASYVGASVRVNLYMETGGTAGDAAGDTYTDIENVIGSAHGDFIVGDTLGNVINGAKGDDRLRGDDGDDTLIGGEGADDIRGGSGIDEANYEDATVRVNLNLLTGGTAGVAAGDTFSSIENVVGSDFGDYIFGSNVDNILMGGDGADRLRGHKGNDTLIGGTGDDNLLGGKGVDEFIFNDGDGADVVVDFQNNVDLIRLLDYGFADVAAALATATEVGSDVVFALGDGDVLTVEDITINQIANDLAIM